MNVGFYGDATIVGIIIFYSLLFCSSFSPLPIHCSQKQWMLSIENNNSHLLSTNEQKQNVIVWPLLYPLNSIVFQLKSFGYCIFIYFFSIFP